MKRIICHLIGCRVTGVFPVCDRCGAADIWGSRLIGYGLLYWPVLTFRWILRIANRLKQQRCEVCGDRMWFSRHEYACSDRCFDKWLPF